MAAQRQEVIRLLTDEELAVKDFPVAEKDNLLDLIRRPRQHQHKKLRLVLHLDRTTAASHDRILSAQEESDVRDLSHDTKRLQKLSRPSRITGLQHARRVAQDKGTKMTEYYPANM